MTEEEYKEFVAKVNSGEFLIGIDRAIARKFYTDIPLVKIEEETVETPYFEKMVVWLAFLAAPITLFASLVLSVLAFRWWAIIAVPLSGVVYFWFSGQSSMPGSGMLGITILLAIAVSSLFTEFCTSRFAPWYLFAVVFAFRASRLVYSAATTFLRGFVLRNQRALKFMIEHIHVRVAEK